MGKKLQKNNNGETIITSNIETKKRIPYTQIGILFFWFCYLFLNNKINLLEGQRDVFFGLYTFASIALYLIVMFYGYRMLSYFDKQNPKAYIKRIISYFLCLLFANFIILVKDIGFSISFGFAKDYVKKILEQPNREYMAYAYVLAVFIIFVPFLKEMLLHLSNTERKWLFYYSRLFYFYDFGVFL